MSPSSEEQYIEEDIATSAQLQKCDMLAIAAAFFGFLFQNAGILLSSCFKDQTLVFIIAFLLGICSIGLILGGYFIGHVQTALSWSQLIPRATVKSLQRTIKIVSYALVGFILVTTVNLIVVYVFKVDPEANSQFLIDAFRKGDRVIRVILLLEICFAAPVFEELAFRLALFRWLSGRGLSVMNASLLTSALFAVAHFLWWGIPGLFLFSLILCRVRRQQDIFSCIGVHSLYNFFVALMTLTASELV